MHSSTVFALLATVAVSYALPGNYVPDGPPPSPLYPTPTGPPSTPSSPDPANNTSTPPAGPPAPDATPTPSPLPPAPAKAPGSGSTYNTCSSQHASACCVGNATPQNGGLLSILGAVAPCGLTLASQVCSDNVYCCEYNNQGQTSLINLQTCGPLVVI